MNIINQILLIVLTLLFFGCKQSSDKKVKFQYSLDETGDKLSFPLDSHTSLLIKALFLYTDKDGKEYLTFQNEKEPEILFYDIQNQKLHKKLKLEVEGNNGVGTFLGYYIKNMDEIYLSSLYFPVIVKINNKGEITQKINLQEHIKAPITASQSMSFCYRPFFFINDKIYIPQSINPKSNNNNDFITKSPLILTFDTLSKEIETSTFTFPNIIKPEDYFTNTLGVEFNYSCCFDKKNIIYSFGSDENIYITSNNNNLESKKVIKSQYIKDITPPLHRPIDIQEGIRKMSEIPLYGNLIHDPYRNVYYRIAYPKTEIDKKENGAEIWQFGRKLFSIIILDHQFNIIGETLLPEYTYISTLMFIREDGLYICDSHYKNPNFEENTLSFRRFELYQNIKDK